MTAVGVGAANRTTTARLCTTLGVAARLLLLLGAGASVVPSRHRRR